MSSRPGSRSGSGSGSGSGSNSNRRHIREQDWDSNSGLPPRLPSLRALTAQRERDAASPSWFNPPVRSYTQQWPPTTTSRRIDRIRQLDLLERDQNLNAENRDPAFEEFISVPTEPWATRTTRERSDDRMRFSTERSTRSTQGGYALDHYIGEPDPHIRLLVNLQHQVNPEYPVPIPNFSPPLRTEETPDIRRSKRRKLDSDKLVPSFKGFRYGQYGQVEPGHLRMEIVSCDGGMFSNESSYAADNILKNDLSVYCTKGPRCNIVLRHQGATVFTLSELVIKAPTSMSYSHPVREGMVFVAMNQDDVLSRTARYEIQYSPKTPNTSNPDEGSIFGAQVLSVQHHDRGNVTTFRSRNPIYCAEENDSNVPQMPPEFAADLPDFRVTVECTEAQEEERHLPPLLRRGANHIGSLPFETHESDEDMPFDHGDPTHRDPNWRYYAQFNNTYPRIRQHLPISSAAAAAASTSRSRDREYLSGRSINDAAEAHAWATQEAIRAVGGELLTPHARFNIEKHKTKCIIHFDPPVSGRFILLKLWSPHNDSSSNIDIQSIIARGFAGPRYFPSVELR